MRDELVSKGTVDDPISSQVPWFTDHVDCFTQRLNDFQQPTLAQMKAHAAARSKDFRNEAKLLGAMSLGSAALAAAAAFGDPCSLLVPVALAGSAAIGVGALGCALAAGRDTATAEEIGQWEQAFGSQKAS
jgi:hypothetical protein